MNPLKKLKRRKVLEKKSICPKCKSKSNIDEYHFLLGNNEMHCYDCGTKWIVNDKGNIEVLEK